MRPLPVACVIAVVSSLTLAPLQAFAGHDDHGKGKSAKAERGGHGSESKHDHHDSGHGGGGLDVDVNLVFASPQRDLARAYFVEHHGHGHCPPGLAKKHNGCIPPGLAKKRYAVGHRLPSGILLEPLPHDLEIRIGLPPSGYRYGLLDGDLVKLAVGSMLVVDAVQGLVD